MSNRFYASAFYLAVIFGSSWIAVTIGEALTRDALTRLALIPSSDSRPSRVATFIAAQERPAPAGNAEKPLVPAAPALSIGALAKGMDDAERAPVQVVEASAVEPAAVPNDQPAAEPIEAPKPRVAGWLKRLPKRTISALSPDETSGRIVLRSLRAEM